jgi:hypothetical protein
MRQAPHTQGGTAAVRTLAADQLSAGQMNSDRLSVLQDHLFHAGGSQAGTPEAKELRETYRSGTLFGTDKASKYTPTDRKAMAGYIKDSSVNTEIRNDTKGIYGTESALDRSIKRHRLQTNTRVYRGLGRSGVLDGVQPGDVVHDKGYASTSLDPSLARRFDEMLVIDVPEGTPVGWNPMITRDNEQEILLPRGSAVKITSVGPDPVHPHLVVVHGELVGIGV